jgi:hypothetical protein
MRILDYHYLLVENALKSFSHLLVWEVSDYSCELLHVPIHLPEIVIVLSYIEHLLGKHVL